MSRNICFLIFLAAAGATTAAAAAGPLAVTVEPTVEAGAGGLPDAPVVDQFGEGRRFREALGPGVFVLGFTYTRCESVCWMTDNWMSVLADARPPGAGPVRLVTLSLDPEHDSPADLLARHRDFGSPPGWLRLTGRPADVVPLLLRLGARDDRPIEEHAPTILVGDAGTGALTVVPADDPLTVDRLVAAIARHGG